LIAHMPCPSNVAGTPRPPEHPFWGRRMVWTYLRSSTAWRLRLLKARGCRQIHPQTASHGRHQEAPQAPPHEWWVSIWLI
jgi:hypothetical protein